MKEEIMTRYRINENKIVKVEEKEATNFSNEEYQYKIFYQEITHDWKGWNEKPRIYIWRKHKDSFFPDDVLDLRILDFSDYDKIANKIKKENKSKRINNAEWGKSSEHDFTLEWSTDWLNFQSFEKYLKYNNMTYDVLIRKSKTKWYSI